MGSLDRSGADGPFACVTVAERDAGDRERGDERGDSGQGHVLHEPAHEVEILGSRGMQQ